VIHLGYQKVFQTGSHWEFPPMALLMVTRLAIGLAFLQREIHLGYLKVRLMDSH